MGGSGEDDRFALPPLQPHGRADGRPPRPQPPADPPPPPGPPPAQRAPRRESRHTGPPRVPHPPQVGDPAPPPRQPAPGGSAALRARLRELEHESSFEAWAALLARREHSRRAGVREEEDWAWGRLYRHTRYHFEDEIIAPRLGAVGDAEEGARGVLLRGEAAAREQALRGRDSGAAAVRASQEGLRAVQSAQEPAQRQAVREEWAQSRAAAAAPLQARLRELREAEGARRQREARHRAALEEEQRMRSAEADRARQQRAAEAERQVHCHLEEQERGRVGADESARRGELGRGCAGCAAALAAVGRSFAELLGDEAARRAGLWAEAAVAAAQGAEQQEPAHRRRLGGAEDAARRAVAAAEGGAAARLSLFRTTAAREGALRLQQWARALRGGTVGRSASRRWIRERIRVLRHDKEYTQGRAALRGQRERCAASIERAREDVARFSTESRLRNLLPAEGGARRGVGDDEAWQRREILDEMRFLVVHEVLLPLRTDLAEAGEPLARTAILHDEGQERGMTEGWTRRRVGATAAREAVLAEEAAGRGLVAATEDQTAGRLFAQEREGAGRAAVAGAERVARAAARREAALQQQQQERCEAEWAEAAGRGAVAGAAERGHLLFAEAIYRCFLGCAQCVVAARLTAVPEPPPRLALWARELEGRCAAGEGLEGAVRGAVQRAEAAGRGRHTAELRRGLDDCQAKLAKCLAQISAIQRWYRALRGGELGWDATLRAVREGLRTVWVEREAALRLAGSRRPSREALRAGHSPPGVADAAAEPGGVLRLLATERRRRGAVASAEGYSWRTALTRWQCDRSEMGRVELRSARLHEDYWRTRIAADQDRERAQCESAATEGITGSRLRPLQRAWRCHRARELRRERIRHCLALASGPAQDAGRAELEAAAAAGCLLLAESCRRCRLEVVTREFEAWRVPAAEASERSAVACEAWRQGQLRLRAAADFLLDPATGALARQERRARGCFMGDAARSMVLLSCQKREEDARLTWVFARDDELIRTFVAHEEVVRHAAEGEAGLSVRRAATVWLLEQEWDRGATAISREYQRLVDGSVESAEALMRDAVAADRGSGLRLLRLALEEGAARRSVTPPGEAAERRALLGRQELGQRMMHEDCRVCSLRTLFRQRLEATERARLGGVRHRAVLGLLAEVEAAERVLVRSAEERARARVALCAAESAGRVRVPEGQHAVLLLRLQEMEGDCRTALEAARACVPGRLAAERGRQMRDVAENSEATARPARALDEGRERAELAGREQRERHEIAAGRIGRRARVKLSWLRLRRDAAELLARHAAAAAGTAAAEERARCSELQEAAGRGRRAAAAARDLRELLAGEAHARRRSELQRGHRLAREALCAQELAARGAPAAEEQHWCRGAHADQEADQRAMLLRAEGPFWREPLLLLEGARRGALQRAGAGELERLRREEAQSAARAALEASAVGERGAVEQAEAAGRAGIADAELWLRTARGSAERDEELCRAALEEEYRRGRQREIDGERLRRADIIERATAAETLQRAWRRYWAVCVVQELQAHRIDELVLAEALARNEAATKLQAWWRGTRVRISGLLQLLHQQWEQAGAAAEWRELRLDAARTMQRALMCHAGHPKIRSAVREANELRVARGELLDSRDFVEELNQHARAIQSGWRMHAVRKRLVADAFGGDWA